MIPQGDGSSRVVQSAPADKPIDAGAGDVELIRLGELLNFASAPLHRLAEIHVCRQRSHALKISHDISRVSKNADAWKLPSDPMSAAIEPFLTMPLYLNAVASTGGVLQQCAEAPSQHRLATVRCIKTVRCSTSIFLGRLA